MSLVSSSHLPLLLCKGGLHPLFELLLIAQLQIVEPRIASSLGQQRCMRATFYNPPFFDYQVLVGIFDCAQAGRNYKCGAALNDLTRGLLVWIARINVTVLS